jgi:hypothetical protein
MIADLHAHYAMRLVARREHLEAARIPPGEARLRDRPRALLVGLASRFGNYRSLFAGPRVTLKVLREGRVKVVLSVLYSFFDELELAEVYPARPKRGYLDSLLGQAELVEQDLADNDRSTAVAVHTPDALAEALRGERVAFIHCVEGGFHLGSTPTNAVPFLSDRLYRWFFPQPDEGLSELGRTAVRAMLRPLTGRHVHISNATRSTPFGRRPIPCRPGLARLGSPCAARMSGRLSATACHPPVAGRLRSSSRSRSTRRTTTFTPPPTPAPSSR